MGFTGAGAVTGDVAGADAAALWLCSTATAPCAGASTSAGCTAVVRVAAGAACGADDPAGAPPPPAPPPPPAGLAWLATGAELPQPIADDTTLQIAPCSRSCC